MPIFSYSGFDAGGKKVSGTVEGSGKRAVMEKLREQGLVLSALREDSTAVRAAGPKKLRWAPRMQSSDLATATRQLATLIAAGLPLDEALATCADQTETPRQAEILRRVRDEVLQGEALHRALSHADGVFPDIYTNMVSVGEASGTLDKTLERLADFLEDQARMKSRIQAAMTYPVLMALVGAGVLFFLFAVVVPKITRMLEDLGQTLPLPTRILIGASELASTWWWLILALIGGAAYGFHRYRSTPGGRLRLDRLTLNLPLVGRLALLSHTSRFTRTLGTLLQNGLPLLQALDISRKLVSNRVLADVLEETALAVREGEGLAAPLKRSGAFPPMVAQMSAVGEKSGNLEELLLRVAATYEQQLDTRINSLLSLLEPVMILVMGSAVGFIVLAILLPIFEASQGMG